MNLTDKVAQSLKTLFTGDAQLPQLVPGGLLYGLEKAGTEAPYASLAIALGETTRMSGVIYAQAYISHIEVWAEDSLPDAAVIQTALESLLGRFTPLASLPVNTRVIHNVLEPEEIGEDPERREGKNVLIARCTYTHLIQQNLLKS